MIACAVAWREDPGDSKQRWPSELCNIRTRYHNNWYYYQGDWHAMS